MDKENSIDNEIDQEEVDSSKGDKKRTSYVYRTHKSMIEFVAIIYKSLGHGEYHSNKEIAAVHKLSYTSIKQQLTSCQYYKLLEIKHSVGYKITDLFTRIYLPISDAEQRAAVVESLKSPETYQQLFKDYEYHIVPPVSGIKNHFVRKFQFKEDVAERAAEIFIENLKDYDLIDSRGVLISGLATKGIAQQQPKEEEKPVEKPHVNIPPEHHQPTPPQKEDDGLFELPIPLPNKRKAYLRYPLDNLTRKDIRVITKALEFIASSLDDEDDLLG